MKHGTLVVFFALWAMGASAQEIPPSANPDPTLRDWNQQILEAGQTPARQAESVQDEYRIGPEDLIEISVFGVPELSSAVRVSAGGEISLPLVGVVKAAGLTPRGLELLLQETLRQTYLKDPHVGIFVREMHSHPVSVFGAVNKPGVIQISGSKSLLEILSLAQGLSPDAGDTVLVMRGGGSPPKSAEGSSSEANTPATEWEQAGSSAGQAPTGQETVKINLKDLIESGDPRYNVPVYPLDTVSVTRAGIVYVVGEVRRPGGFVLKTNENISVLQALALSEGLTPTSKKSAARIIRTNKVSGQRDEIAVDLGKVLEGKDADLVLQPNDVLFVPNSTARSVLYRGSQTAISTLSGLIIWRR